MSSTQEPSQGQKAITTETTVVTTTASTGAAQESSLSLDEQMVSELLGQQGDFSTDLPFIISELPPASSSFVQTGVAPSQAPSTRDEEILAEIHAELEAEGQSGSVDGDTIPSSIAGPVTPTPPAGSPHLDSSSEEDVDIMPPAEEQPPERRSSKRRISVPSDSDDEPLIRKPWKKE